MSPFEKKFFLYAIARLNALKGNDNKQERKMGGV